MSKQYRPINIGVVGAGYMGKAHSLALHSVGATFDTILRPVPYMIATRTADGAEIKRQELGFLHATHHWQDMVNDNNIDAIVIASPQSTHKDIALAAFANKKHVFCEKPLSCNLKDSQEMANIANQSGMIHMVGFNYAQTPAMQMAKKMIDDDVIGDVHFIRAEHTEDFFANARAPGGYRTIDNSTGTMGDLAPHMINGALTLVGDIKKLVADIGTLHHQRPSADGKTTKNVNNDDYGHFLCEFTNGAKGNLYFSRVATGNKLGYRFEIYGTKGAIKFDQEDMNSLWYYDMNAKDAYHGFTKILMGHQHPDFYQLCPGDGHGTGYGEQITIEIKNFLTAIAENKVIYPSFDDGFYVDKIVHAAFESYQKQYWVTI